MNLFMQILSSVFAVSLALFLTLFMFLTEWRVRLDRGDMRTPFGKLAVDLISTLAMAGVIILTVFGVGK